MGLVTIDEDYLTSIADSIRLMRQTTNRITTDSMSNEIRKINIGWNPDDYWERPAQYPDYSAIDISDFEGMYLTYDRTVDDPWIGITCTVDGGYRVERGYIYDGQFIVEETSNVDSGVNYLHPILPGIYDYVVYRITPQVAGSHITRMGQLNQTVAFFDGAFAPHQAQPLIERYGRLPYITAFSQWANFNIISDTTLDLTELTTVAGLWYNDFKIQNIDLSGFNSRVASCAQTFRNCYKLKYLNVPNLVTSACTNMNEMFLNNYNLPYIDTANWDTSNVTTFASAFNTCYNLYKLDVSHFDTSNATTMASMFINCNKLTQLDVSGFNTSKVTSFSSMFRTCAKLKSLDVTHFDTSNATNMSYMFANLYSAEHLDPSGFNTKKLTNSTNMFVYLQKIRTLDLSGWDMSKVTDVSYMFDNCHSLEELNISGWTLSALTKAQNTFNACNSLRVLNMDGVTTTNLFKADNCMNATFSSMYHVKKLDLSGWDLSELPASYASVFRYDYCLEQVILPDSFNEIAATFFGDCRSLKVLVLPSPTVVQLANTNAFGNTPANKIIYVPDELIDDYKVATNWKSVACEFKGLSELE